MRIRDQNQSQTVSGEKKNEVKHHGYEDSEKYIEATMRSQSSAQSSRREETMKSTEQSKANSRQEKSVANSRQGKPKVYDRDKAKYAEKHSTEESCSQPVPEASKG